MFVVIDLGGTRLRVALAGTDGRLRAVVRRSTEAAAGPDHVIGRIVETVEHLLDRQRLPARRVRALAIGLPGPVDPKAGVVFYAPNLPGWRDVPLNKILTRSTGIASYLHHDAHLAAFGEFHRGAARGARHAAYVTVSTGIGAGLILDGRLYGGARGTAGEVGHIVIQEDGPLCPCGNRGCLEALASGTAIAREARDALARGARSRLRQIAPQGATARDVVRAARQGDVLAHGILERAGTALGIGMGTLVNLLNPQVIVLGGSVVRAGSLLLQPMRVALQQSSWEIARRELRIVRPMLGPDAGLYGALEWARLRAGS